MLIAPKHLKMFPPCLVRMMARVKRSTSITPMTTSQISKASGIPLKRVYWMASQTTWDQIPIGDAIRFIDGCGLAREPVSRMRWFMQRNIGRREAFRFLEKLPTDERRKICSNFQKLMNQSE